MIQKMVKVIKRREKREMRVGVKRKKRVRERSEKRIRLKREKRKMTAKMKQMAIMEREVYMEKLGARDLPEEVTYKKV